MYAGVTAATCNELYPTNRPIEIPNTTELCNSFFVVRYNNTVRASVATFEVVRPSSGTKLARVNNFHPDRRVNNPVFPSLYTQSGYDKGHMTPAGDANTPEEMSETFAMTNMTPQEPTLNRVSWRELEEYIRHAVNKTNVATKVATIAVYDKSTTNFGIPVPTGYFKVAYFASGTEVYYADNIVNSKVSRAPLS